MDFFTKAQTIRTWADTLESRALLPQIVRRLVMATVPDVTAIDFPAFESIQRSGFDGLTESTSGNEKVPAGRTVWELSTEKKVRSKADGDFEKRTAEVAENERRQTTFVFVTPRQFREKANWVAEKSGQGAWKEVRAYDADDLEQWAEKAPPGFRCWLGRRMGVRPHGVDDVEQKWSAISSTGSHTLLPSVFLAGREKNRDIVFQWLSAGPALLGVTCRSPVEVIDFYCALVADMEESERIPIEARCVIVEDGKAWFELRDSLAPAVIVVDPSLSLSPEEYGRAVANGHHVLVAREPSLLVAGGFELERASRFELSQALEKSGYSPVKAEQFARAAGGSLAILKHRLDPPSRTQVPAWVSQVRPEVIAAALLLGGWGSKQADLRAFSTLAGQPFEDCESDLARMSRSLHPLLIHAAGNWRLISKDYAWSLFENHITPSSLKKFEALAQKILVDDDPRYDLPEEKRFYAGIHGHIPQYSDTAKKHVAETLAFLGAFCTGLSAASSMNIEATVDRIVAAVLSPTSTWHRWASLGSRLPLLAEASPTSFLSAVRIDLDKAQPELAKLLRPEEDALFGRCNHSGLLWALEGLAWPTETLGDVAEILLRLSELDTGESRWSNRPTNSLHEIMLHWIPHTTANLKDRIAVLDRLIRQNREAAWPILLKLLPSHAGEFSSPTHRPYWRAWADEWERGVTRRESFDFVTAVGSRVIAEAGVNPQRWTQVFAAIGQFPHTVQPELVDAATSFSQTDLVETERRMAAEELAEQISRHRRYKDADWALPVYLLDRLESVLKQLQPRGAALRNVWLFGHWPERYYGSGENLSESEKALAAARQKALSEVLAEEGIEGILSLVRTAEAPGVVGHVLADLTADQYLHQVIPIFLDGDERSRNFASGFVWKRYCAAGWEWIDSVLPHCKTPQLQAALLTIAPFNTEVWKRAESAGEDAQRIYWQTCRAFNSGLSEQDVIFAVQTLCQHERPSAAIDLLSMAIHNKLDVPSDTLAVPLEKMLELPPDKAEDQRNRLDAYHIQQVIESLQTRTDFDNTRLIRIEWHYIRLLDGHHGHSPKALEKHLSTTPEFFLEVLSCCYRSDNEAQAPASHDDPGDKPYMAAHAHHLLHEWDRVPGTRADDSIDEIELSKWCNDTRQLAASSGRLDVCDSHIGQLFAKSKQKDVDETWPCAAIRHVAEVIQSESLESGMSCGIFNSRGAHFRHPGGDQERSLAAKYRELANRFRQESPFVARVLDAVSKDYEHEARDWDERERWEEK